MKERTRKSSTAAVAPPVMAAATDGGGLLAVRSGSGRWSWVGAMAVVSQWTAAATSSVEAAGGGFLSRLRVDRAVDEQGRCSEGGQEKWRANGKKVSNWRRAGGEGFF
jgi:hypothetical protein